MILNFKELIKYKINNNNKQNYKIIKIQQYNLIDKIYNLKI